MTVYIALLRGINVGGKNIIKMLALKQVLEAMGLYEVQTYIQSGNILFKTDVEQETLHKKIEQEIENAFGFSVVVVLRTANEFEQIIQNCPFTEKEVFEAEVSSEVESLYVCLLTHIPLQEKVQLLDKYQNESDEYRIIGREVYLLFQNSIRNSKLANNLNKLDISSTVRNWKTMNKLALLAEAMNS